MAVKWTKIYRGGVQRTTPETLEVAAPLSGSLYPGQCVALGATGLVDIAGAATEGKPYYFVGEPLFGSLTADIAVPSDPVTGKRDNARLYIPHSGDMYAGRAAAGVARVNDLPLTVDASGNLKAATLGTDRVVAYMDVPRNATGIPTAVTTLGELIPIRIFL